MTTRLTGFANDYHMGIFFASRPFEAGEWSPATLQTGARLQTD
jgi:hypothetical protein